MIKKINLLHDFENQKKSIHEQLTCGIISLTDATNELNMISKKELKVLKSLVDMVHINKDGTKRKISFNERKGLFSTKMPDGSHLYGKNEEVLYQKLMNYYNILTINNSIKGIFELAIAEKARTENNNENTIQHYRADYNRFISKEFSAQNIKTITKSDLKAYTQDLVKEYESAGNPLKKKAFLQYKCVLNLIFRYADEHDIISINPVSGIKNSVYLKSCDHGKFKSEQKILSESEIALIMNCVHKRMESDRYHGYFICGYIILFAIETGMRAAELCSLRWDDIKKDHIHIHSQQLSRKAYYKEKNDRPKGSQAPKTKQYYYADWTKDEKGISRDGRKFPLTNNISAILDELQSLQNRLGISSDYVFCNQDGEWVKTDAYETCLRRLCTSLGLEVTNNHAFRMSLNSNVFIPLGIPVTERAQLLGHSVQTNETYYSFARKDNLDNTRDLLNKMQVTPKSSQKLIVFPKKESSESTKFKALN